MELSLAIYLDFGLGGAMLSHGDRSRRSVRILTLNRGLEDEQLSRDRMSGARLTSRLHSLAQITRQDHVLDTYHVLADRTRLYNRNTLQS